MKGKTATAVAAELGVAVSTVTRQAEAAGLGTRFGASIVLMPADVKKIAKSLRKARPKPLSPKVRGKDFKPKACRRGKS